MEIGFGKRKEVCFVRTRNMVGFMKKIPLILLLFVCFCTKKNSSQTDNETIDTNTLKYTNKRVSDTKKMKIFMHENKDDMLDFISQFYKEYIYLFNNSDINSLNSLVSNNCSKKLTNRILNKNIDGDIFLNAQDADSNLWEKLNIRGDSINDFFIVSYSNDFNNEVIKIKLYLFKDNNTFKFYKIIPEPSTSCDSCITTVFE